ncbi:hypothetical protein [Umezawaea tangerina]|uniref:ABC-2 type transport system permease protein n=1 Tax=Umezawaea tangerina TaxID=84725 RepID=A0A2T0SWM2_9PSEU|nr:hypothetical protein [Umezawaea tangerina]PRY37817.1 hypothetical protein CLV43_10937 [Umezawaea tangerina]
MTARTVGHTVHAELLKLATLPSVRLVVVATWVVTPLLDLVYARTATTASAVDVGLAPLGYSELGFVLLGALVAASEHDGQIRTSLTCVPNRVGLQLAKSLTLAALCLVVASVTAVLSLATARTARPDGPFAPFGPGATAIAHLVLTAVLAAAVATVLRAAVPALTLLLGYYVVAAPLIRGRLDLLPDTVDGRQALVVPACWALIAVATATAVFHRRDA